MWPVYGVFANYRLTFFFSRLGSLAAEKYVRSVLTKMDIGTIYDVVYKRGKYEIEYENGVKCIKKNT